MLAYTNYTRDARVRREAETLAGFGYEVTVLSLRENERQRCRKLNGVDVRELSVGKYRGHNKIRYLVSYLLFLIHASLVCNWLWINRRIDAIHVHNMPDFLVIAAIVPKLWGKKVVLDIHDSIPETFCGKFGEKTGSLYRLLCLEEALSCSVADRILCVNHIQRNAIVERGVREDKISVCMNVPDHRIFDDNGSRLESGHHDSFRLVYHGTVERMLGIDLTIRAVAMLKKRIPSLVFHIIGTGMHLEEFEDLSTRLGLEDNVHFSRKSYPVDVLPSVLKDMDLGVISNRRTSATELMLPVKMLEYIALGIPVVAPRLRTIEHYFSEDMLTFFTPGNAASLADAIFSLYRSQKRRESQSMNARRFLEKYGWPKHQRSLIEFYDHL